MSVQMMLFTYAVLMIALAVIIHLEFARRLRGSRLKPGSLEQVDSTRISYSLPPDRSKRSLQQK